MSDFASIDRNKLPPYTQAYRLVLAILKNSKLKNLRRVQVKLTRLYHIPEALSVKQVSVFIDFVQFNVKSGKFRKNAYRIILIKGKRALIALADHVIEEGGSANTEKHIDKLNTTMETPLVKQVGVAKGKRKVALDKAAAKQMCDDEMFLKATYKTDVEALDVDDEGIITRSIVFFNTMIPQNILRPMAVEYGFQSVTHYLMASHATLIGAPLTRNDQRLSEDEVLQVATQVLRLRNKIRAKHKMEPLAMFGKKVNTLHHAYWLLLPKRVIDDANVRIGRWEFSTKPKCADVSVARFVD